MFKPRINEDAERARETYRCYYCGQFIKHNTDGFFDRTNRDDESSTVVVFCNESHADSYAAAARKSSTPQLPKD